jgi:Flp pilus assembly protein TadG
MRSRRSRRAVAAVELAVLLPFLAFLFVIAVDWARIFYYSLICTNCARNGAIWAADPYGQQSGYSCYNNLTSAALADAPQLTPSPTVTSTNGTDNSGNSYVTVSVSFPFQTITNFPGVPTTTNIVRTVQMDIAPTQPK